MNDPEAMRLAQDAEREGNWKRWGTYLSERQWATVREDYSADGDCWAYFPHEHARSRAYRWGEDGLLGFCDRQCRLCFAVTLWNGRDPILKERLFGLTGPEGNHGEDVKEVYAYEDATPTYSYCRASYRYPHDAFPYQRLRDENRARDRTQREFDLEDTGIFDDDRFFDVTAEYAKDTCNSILIRVTVHNRAREAATVHVLPTLWFRNTWSWGQTGEEAWPKPSIVRLREGRLVAEHATLGRYVFEIEPVGDRVPDVLFTENETNAEKLFGSKNPGPFVKDGFHSFIVEQRDGTAHLRGGGTRVAPHFTLDVPAGGSVVLRMRLFAEAEEPKALFGNVFEQTFRDRIREADVYYAARIDPAMTPDARDVVRRAYAGLLWSKQFYQYPVAEWLAGDAPMPPPPAARLEGRNAQWTWLHARDVVSMPDKWEYPWFAAWDLAFHTVAFARIDPQFAKDQLVLLLREWYMHPNGQIPAYEFALGDVNPPVHAWAAWRVYKIAAQRGQRDTAFLARVFHKLLLNFTWWVNRKDSEGNNLFSGGFLGLDNVGVFDRSKPLPVAGHLAQADGTAWMAFYCATMLEIALELASVDPVYEDMASKFFEHFVAITDAMNSLGGTGLWDELDGFYYDQLVPAGGDPSYPLRVRSMVGIIPLFAVAVIEDTQIARLPGFTRRMDWFLQNRRDLAQHIAYMTTADGHRDGHRLLAIPTRDRLARVLRYVLDEAEFLSPYGVRSLSRVHLDRPYVFHAADGDYTVRYVPGESETGLFGGNSNWRGPIWMPVNYLLVEALERYHHFYGENFRIECPTGSGRWRTLQEVAREISTRVTRIFLPDSAGRRPCNGEDQRYVRNPLWRSWVHFHEYFDGDTGRGCGASHQTGWTALVARLMEDGD